MDDTSSFLANDADRNFPQNSHNYRAEHALSSFDTPHRAVVSFVYALPFHDRLLRNLETAGIIVAQSGQPFTPILQFDNSNTGNTGGTFGSDRPNVVGNPSLSNPSAQEWFNTAAFAIPPQYTFRQQPAGTFCAARDSRPSTCLSPGSSPSPIEQLSRCKPRPSIFLTGKI